MMDASIEGRADDVSSSVERSQILLSRRRRFATGGGWGAVQSLEAKFGEAAMAALTEAAEHGAGGR